MKIVSRDGRFSLLRLGLVASVLMSAISAGALGTAASPAAALNSQITGTVFEDFNNNGVQDTTTAISNSGAGTVGVAVDRGVGGITVTAFDINGTNVGSTTSGATGAYSLFVPTPDGPFRLEFSTLPAGYQPAFAGAGNGTSVQFVPDGASANINFGIVNPVNYCQNNPELATSCHRQGDQVNGGNSAMAVAYGFPYAAGAAASTNTVAPYDVPVPTALLIANQIGTTLGITYRRSTRDLFYAAYFKKFAGFGPGQDGNINTPDDSGAVYRQNRTTGAITGIFTVPGATTNSHDVTDYLRDNGNIAWDAVGKTSLGGMVISDDGTRLYVMNLENRTLYALSPDTGAVLASQAVPLTGHTTPGGTAATCAAGDVRPFAVEYYNGSVYVGIVCSAESTQSLNDLFGYVYAVDATTLAFAATPIFQLALNYPRGLIEADKPAEWRAWTPVFTVLPVDPDSFIGYPQPMLTGIQFDNGNLILAFRDRFGDQNGNEALSNPANNTLYTAVSAGDLLRACGNFSAWTLESNARCAGLGNGPQGNGQGPGNGSYYWGEGWYPVGSPFFHDEVSVGTIVQVPGFPEVVLNTFNPIPGNAGEEAFDAGTRWLTNNTGDLNKAYRIYNGAPADGNTFAKANGLGDLVALCDEAPIQLGNRVWNDLNSNGRQDPNEPALANIAVELTDGAGGTVLATTTTGTDGTYYFSTTTTGLILQNTAYQIRVNTTQAGLAGFNLTLQNSVAGGNGVSDTSNNAITDVRDSDAATGGNFAVIPYTTGGAGASNHGLDFGFTSQAPPPQFDWGDNPDTGTGTGPGNYNTLLSDNGPRHQIVSGLLLGATIDAEPDGQPNVPANGDDTNLLYPGVADDEDGVTVADLTLTIGNPANVRVNATNTTGQAATLCGFIDFNGDGDFLDAGENVSVVVPTGSNNAQFTLAFGAVPAGSAAATYSRFRLALGTAACAPIGEATSGEVEDYPVTINATPLAGLGDFVWFDANRNGLQDQGEPGVPGVTANLLNNVGTVISTTTTDANGLYQFLNLQPGTYSVCFIRPPNYDFTLPNVGSNPAIDSDANPTTGCTPQVTLAPGEYNPTIDAGLVTLLAGLGDYVWLDVNRNGIQDAGEPGVGNVTVNLLNSSGTVISTTTTSAVGFYSFLSLQPGTYSVCFVRPPGYDFTIPNAGGNDGLDSDADPTTGCTQQVTLAAGEFNPTLDAGLVTLLSGLGDFVWNDLNRNGIQDVGEPGVPNVTVNLLNSSGTVISTTTTSPNGLYSFISLQPGTYSVCFIRPPGYVFTPPNVGGDDTIDSDADMVTGCTPQVTLAPGEFNPTIDAGVYLETNAPQLILRKQADIGGKAQVSVGDLITYTLIVTNTGGLPASAVVVSDTVPTGTDYVAGSSVPPATVDGRTLVWSLGTLNPGLSRTMSFVVRVVGGTGVTAIRNVGQTSSNETTTSDSNETTDTFQPNAIALASFAATVEGSGVKVAWRTSMEKDTWGFFILRSATGERADATKVNTDLIVARGRNGGGDSYSLTDPNGAVNTTYWLQEVEVSGKTIDYGPVKATAPAVLNPVPVTVSNPQPAPVTVVNPVAVAGPQPQASIQQSAAPAAVSASAPASTNANPSASSVMLGAVPGASNAPATNAQAVVVGQSEAAPAAAMPAVIAPAMVRTDETADQVRSAEADASVPMALSSALIEERTIVAASTETSEVAAVVQAPAAPREAAGAANAVNVVRGQRAASDITVIAAPSTQTQTGNPLPFAAIGFGLIVALAGAGTAFAAIRRRRKRDA